MPIAPTLILGLGGTGSKIVERVAEKVKESRSSQYDRIAYVVFDTDINDLSGIRQRNPQIHTVQTSTRNTVGEYLNINVNARDNWFPVNEMLNRKTLTEGAAQVRAISRLAFDTTLKGGNLHPLHQAVEQLFRLDKDQEEQSLRVMITSSLAGGTGSGLILSVAMYLTNFLRTKYPKAKAITRGFFVQPDVFYEVITAPEEQQNLQVNAYAAVRELDAFLMRGDDTLPRQYQDLRFEFPIVGSDGVESIDGMPYDFCFLFDANNTASGSLDSFATYLDHAATCIYTQSIGPMSKKSNSREDNVLREVIKNDGRNRYAGAGASRLVYPWPHVRDVVAYQWADQALSTQWLEFDRQFMDRQAALAQQRESGFAARDLDRPAEFIGAVDSAAENKHPFARAVQSQCLAYDEEGISVIGRRWEEYLTALKNHVDRSGRPISEDSLKRSAAARVAALSESADDDDYIAAYYELKKYHDIVARNTEETAGLLGYSMFKADSPTVTKDRHPHQLETYLRDKVSGSFIHPVAARYFLYQAQLALKSQKRIAQTELDNVIQFFDNFERNAFDDPSTDEVESPEQFASRKRSMMERFRGRPGATLTELMEKFQNYMKKVDRLRELSVYAAVLDEAIQYATGLASSFETFFRVLEGNLKRLRTTVDQMRTKYDDLTGSTTRYVLAKSTSLDSLYRSMPYGGGVVNVDSDLAEAIYSKVRAYHMLTDDKDGNYFQDLYRNTIIGHFADRVMESYGTQIKMDVIEALEREYRVEEKNFEEANVSHYVVGEIEKVKRMAAPFLETPLGEERHPIVACAYNPSLEGDSDPKRKKLISKQLSSYGGERDEEISPHEILFYNAIYGIRASDLSKYSPARSSRTERRAAGQYFAAYYQLVSGIRPSVDKTKVITPHIDRRWHWVSQLPDLDDGNQELQYQGIHRALMLGLIYQRIRWVPVHESQHVYQYQCDQPANQDFYVSNGTPCDHFYELVDALTIDPVAVNEITESVQRHVAILRQEARTVAFRDIQFARTLREGIKVPELRQVVPELGESPITIFDLAAFYAMSIPQQSYDEADLHRMVTNFVGLVRTYVESVEDESDVATVFEEAVLQQFRAFKKNVPAYLENEGRAFARKVAVILRPLISALGELHCRSATAEIVEFDEELLEVF